MEGPSREVAFDDAGPLILLAQLRRKGLEISDALGWYDHLLIDEAQDLSLVELQTLMLATTGDGLLAAVALYEKLGYRVCGKFGPYEDHPASLFMEKNI